MKTRILTLTAITVSVLGLYVFCSGAGMYISVPLGTIHDAYVEYNDSNTIDITAGYGECNGNYWEILTKTSHDMTTLASGEDFHYIYVDDDGSTYPDPNIYDSTTEPSYSESKLGFYNGNDRCIGVVWSPDSNSTILEFTNNSNQQYAVDSVSLKIILANGNPTGSNVLAEATAYTPVNSIAARLFASNTDLDDGLTVAVRTYESNSARIFNQGYYWCAVGGWVEFERGASRDFYWYGYDNDDNSFYVLITGYQIER